MSETEQYNEIMGIIDRDTLKVSYDAMPEHLKEDHVRPLASSFRKIAIIENKCDEMKALVMQIQKDRDTSMEAIREAVEIFHLDMVKEYGELEKDYKYRLKQDKDGLPVIVVQEPHICTDDCHPIGFIDFIRLIKNEEG